MSTQAWILDMPSGEKSSLVIYLAAYHGILVETSLARALVGRHVRHACCDCAQSEDRRTGVTLAEYEGQRRGVTNDVHRWLGLLRKPH